MSTEQRSHEDGETVEVSEGAIIEVFRAVIPVRPPAGNLLRANGEVAKPVMAQSNWMVSKAHAVGFIAEINRDNGDRAGMGIIQTGYVPASKVGGANPQAQEALDAQLAGDA